MRILQLMKYCTILYVSVRLSCFAAFKELTRNNYKAEISCVKLLLKICRVFLIPHWFTAAHWARHGLIAYQMFCVLLLIYSAYSSQEDINKIDKFSVCISVNKSRKSTMVNNQYSYGIFQIWFIANAIYVVRDSGGYQFCVKRAKCIKWMYITDINKITILRRWHIAWWSINTQWPGENGRQFATDVFKCVFYGCWCLCVPKSWFNNTNPKFQIQNCMLMSILFAKVGPYNFC